MTNEEKVKLNKIFNDNKGWPLLIEGVSAKNFPHSVVISADIDSACLGVVPGETGLKYPSWVMQLNILSKKTDRVVLVIDQLDSVSQDEQEKFYGIVKYSKINGYSFPKSTQIIITVSKGGIDKISTRLKSLTIPYKVAE